MSFMLRHDGATAQVYHAADELSMELRIRWKQSSSLDYEHGGLSRARCTWDGKSSGLTEDDAGCIFLLDSRGEHSQRPAWATPHRGYSAPRFGSLLSHPPTVLRVLWLMRDDTNYWFLAISVATVGACLPAISRVS